MPIEDPRRPAVLERLAQIGIVGASQAAGFGTGVGFADTLDVVLRVPHQIHDSSVALMHLGAQRIGRLQITALELRRVSTVFAVDFLFWFAYGDKPLSQRRADLREGMAMLESLGVPVFVGDLPDVHGASQRMIGQHVIPPASELQVLNAQLRAWAEDRPEIVLLPLSSWMDAIRMETPVQLQGRRVTLRTGEGLQWDLLHPTVLGQAVLTLLVVECVQATWGGLSPDDVRHRPAVVVDLVTPSREPAPAGALPAPPG